MLLEPNILNRVDKWWWFDAAMPKQGKKEEWRWSGESRAQQIRLESSSLLWKSTQYTVTVVEYSIECGKRSTTDQIEVVWEDFEGNRYCLHVPCDIPQLHKRRDFWTKDFPTGDHSRFQFWTSTKTL